MTHLLDSNVWISLLRGKLELVSERYRNTSPQQIRCCSIVVAELLYGCERSAKPEDNRNKVAAILAPIQILDYDRIAAECFVNIRIQLEKVGQVIGAYDMQIAAIALANQCTLVTHNVAEFSRISGLTVLDWQVDD